MGPRSDFSKPRQGAAEKSANATRRCCLVRGSQPVGISTEETFVFAASFCTMRRFLCLKNFGRPCRAPNPEVGCEPGGVINIFLKIHRFHASFFAFCRVLRASASLLCPLLGNSFKNFRTIVGRYSLELLHGHTHVPAWTDFGQGNLYLNPGSVSIPKENTAHSYMTMEGSTACWKTMEGACYHQLQL